MFKKCVYGSLIGLTLPIMGSVWESFCFWEENHESTKLKITSIWHLTIWSFGHFKTLKTACNCIKSFSLLNTFKNKQFYSVMNCYSEYLKKGSKTKCFLYSSWSIFPINPTCSSRDAKNSAYMLHQNPQNWTTHCQIQVLLLFSVPLTYPLE